MEYTELWRRLAQVYDEGEAKAIARLVLDVRFGLSMADVLCGALERLTPVEQQALEQLTARLLAAEPVQYVLGEADFCGRQFHVAPGVLIPRPETEELCRWVLDDMADADRPVRLLDIGTGSGCLAVTLAATLTGSRVTAWDVSADALRIARSNAGRHGASVDFRQQDALHPPADRDCWEAIVSNPPYICECEAADMARNVLDYEPHQALFVPDSDPLLFYRAIARYAQTALRPGGRLYLEINPRFGQAVADGLRQQGFLAECRQDAYGKVRMVRGIKTSSKETTA